MYGLTPRVIKTYDTVITAPVQPPMRIEYAKRHIRTLSNAEDVLIAAWINAAAQFFEEQTGRQLITATRELWLDRFPCEVVYPFGTITGRRIELPYPPLQSVTSVQYVSSDGTVQDFTDGGSPESNLWTAKTPAGPYAERGWIEPTYGASWPIAREESGAVRIRYVCGYGDTDSDVPDLVIGALAFLVGNFDQNRSAEAFRTGFGELPMNIEAILQPFKYSAYPREAPLR